MNEFTVAKVVCKSCNKMLGEVRVNGKISKDEAMFAIDARFNEFENIWEKHGELYDVDDIDVIYDEGFEYEPEEIAYYMMGANLEILDTAIEYRVYIDGNGRLSNKYNGSNSFVAYLDGMDYLKITSEEYGRLDTNRIIGLALSKERLDDEDFMRAVSQITNKVNSYIS